jgi:hypothetical protein
MPVACFTSKRTPASCSTLSGFRRVYRPLTDKPIGLTIKDRLRVVEQRERFEEITCTRRRRRSGTLEFCCSATAITRKGSLSRTAIAEALGHVNSVDRIRKLFVVEGEQSTLERKPRA